MLMSATCPEKLVEDILKDLSIQHCEIIRAMTPRPEISYNISTHPSREAAERKLREELRLVIRTYEDGEKALVYCRGRAAAESLASSLRCSAFHGKRQPEDFKKEWEEFVTDPRKTIAVTTSILSVGIDIPHVRNVWHLGIPWTLIDYVQETGRAGRDGANATCHLLTWDGDGSNRPTGYTEADLHELIAENVNCRRVKIGEVIDGCPTSCSLLRNPHLCDNCKKVTHITPNSTGRVPPPIMRTELPRRTPVPHSETAPAEPDSRSRISGTQPRLASAQPSYAPIPGLGSETGGGSGPPHMSPSNSKRKATHEISL